MIRYILIALAGFFICNLTNAQERSPANTTAPTERIIETLGLDAGSDSLSVSAREIFVDALVTARSLKASLGQNPQQRSQDASERVTQLIEEILRQTQELKALTSPQPEIIVQNHKREQISSSSPTEDAEEAVETLQTTLSDTSAFQGLSTEKLFERLVLLEQRLAVLEQRVAGKEQ